MRRLALLMLLFVCIPTLAKEKPVMQKAKVISQDIGSRDRGVYAAPIGSGIIGIPLRDTWNIVLVETEKHRMEWHEKGEKFIVLAVNGEIEFYQDKDNFIVLDSKGKKHKFSLVHMEAIEKQKAPKSLSPASADPGHRI
ncbi:MAG: hypothetical protein JXA73_22975 [Acidobacteria bacterium]|nr:hypothetical protein [Acidobacteriota bacterium]